MGLNTFKNFIPHTRAFLKVLVGDAHSLHFLKIHEFIFVGKLGRKDALVAPPIMQVVVVKDWLNSPKWMFDSIEHQYAGKKKHANKNKKNKK
tara:strand:+ start:3317 stop:3592 length:276 start_codon:yes stop_codon:yes gene_type:complete